MSYLRSRLARLPTRWATLTALLLLLPAALRARMRQWEERGRGRDDGYSTEFMVITAALVTAAIVIVAVIARKLMDKANGLDL